MRHQTPIADPDSALADASAHRGIALRGEQVPDHAELKEQLRDTVAVGPDPTGRERLTVTRVAREYGIPSWAYTHQRELGAIRPWTGLKPRLRVDPETGQLLPQLPIPQPK